MFKRACSGYSKKKIATLVLILVLPLFLTACSLGDLPVVGRFFGGGGGGSSIGPADLTVWGMWENPEVMNVLIQKFNETYPDVNISYDDRSILKPVEYKERAFRRATEDSSPDVMRVHISWLPKLRDLLAPMPKDMMSVETFSSSFYPVAVENLVKDNQIYGIPAYYDGLVLVYNKSHFEEIGQLEPPTAWEEFRRLALELTKRNSEGNIVRAGAAVGNADNIDFFSDIIGMLFSQAKVDIPEGVDTKPAQDALSFYTNFILEDRVWSDALPEASAAFAQEKVSMIFVPSWNLLDILNARPDLNIGVAPVPQAALDKPATWASFWVDVVPKASDEPEAAWGFINFIASEEQQLLGFNEDSKYRVFGAPYSMVNLSGELVSNPYLNPLLESAPYAKTYEIAARSGNRHKVEALRTAINNMLRSRSVLPETVLSEFKAALLQQ